MSYPVSGYVEERNGGLYIAGARISLDSVVISFQEGASPEEIAKSFSTLELWQVYGAIAYYLQNEDVIKEYIAEGRREFERRRVESHPSKWNPELWARLESAREKMGLKRQ